MHFKSHKSGFVMFEVMIALAVIGILLTAILQLQLVISYRSIMNKDVWVNVLSAKKELLQKIRDTKRSARKNEKEDAIKDFIAQFKTSPLLIPVTVKKEWNVFMHTRSVDFFFIMPGIQIKKSGEKNEM